MKRAYVSILASQIFSRIKLILFKISVVVHDFLRNINSGFRDSSHLGYEIIIAFVVLSIFHLKIYQKNIFLFFKNYF